MSKSARRSGKTAARAADQPSASGEGQWGLDLWNGSAWFSDWFYERLQWPKKVKRKRLEDLRPNLPGGAWESLLLAIRDHLELQKPLDLQVCARLVDGRIEWWHIEGMAERNAAGQPVYLACSTRDVSA